MHPASVIVDRFFFYCYGYHRNLHSFPTRRSSDLSENLSSCSPVPSGMVLSICPGTSSSCKLVERTLESLCTLRDRKSTRLNSSHTVSSYAVFCMKKKTGS